MVINGDEQDALLVTYQWGVLLSFATEPTPVKSEEVARSIVARNKSATLCKRKVTMEPWRVTNSRSRLGDPG